MKTGNTIAELRAEGVDFEDWFIAGTGFSPEQVTVNSLFLGEPLPDLAHTSGIIITGSPAYITDLEPWNEIAAAYILDAYDRGVPMLGVCYGHQLLAWAFGGEVDFHPQGREIGSVRIELTGAGREDVLLGAAGHSFVAQVSHQQSVMKLPVQAVRLALNDFDPNHGFRIGDRAWGIQFHPEFDAEITRAYIEARKEDIQREGLDSEALLRGVQASPESAAILQRFAGLVREQV